MEWISVKERFPEEEGDYLVCKFALSMRPRTIISVEHGAPYDLEMRGVTYHNFGWSGTHSTLKVTHWMPLPEPPKGE